MGFKSNILVLWISTVIIAGSIPANAFMGDYISMAEGDMAVIVNIKSSDIEYESDDGEAGDIDRRILAVGLSKSVRPEIKLFGSINYTFNGELPLNDALGRDSNADLENGYGISAGGSYLFYDQGPFAVQGYGQINYTFKETLEYSNSEFTFDGYELLLGVMGSYHWRPNLQIYTALQLIPYSDFSMDLDGDLGRSGWDLERDQFLGGKIGVLYDLESWFVKGEVEFGSERAYGILSGIKF